MRENHERFFRFGLHQLLNRCKSTFAQPYRHAYASDLYLRVMRHNEGRWKVSLRPVASVIEKVRAAWVRKARRGPSTLRHQAICHGFVERCNEKQPKQVNAYGTAALG